MKKLSIIMLILAGLVAFSAPVLADETIPLESGGLPWAAIVSSALGILVLVSGLSWKKTRTAAIELKELFEIIAEASADNNISNDEVMSIVQAGKEAGVAVKEVVIEIIALFQKNKE